MDEPRVLLEVTHEVHGRTGRVVLDGRLVRATTLLLPPAVATLLAEGTDTIEVDTRRVRAIDAAGRDALAAAHRQAADSGVELRVLTGPD
jgi:ABC-type transporter Mla MlaB component